MGIADKAKDLAGEHRDKIDDQVNQQIDNRVEGDKADKVKDAARQGLDKVLGEGDK